MDKKSWPWKKKTSHKLLVVKSEASTAASETGTTHVDKVKQDNNTKSKYVQISMESYTHLTGLEDQVKSYKEQVQSYEEQVQSYEEHMQSYEEQVQSLEEEVNNLNEKLSEANTEMTNKESLVKQHSKVAEEAVSGWEKAEAEAAALKSHLESVTLLKLTAEDRASHLDGALKECMRQIRNMKDDHEQKLHEVVLQKTKLFDKMKLELESKIMELDLVLMGSTAENSALSRSLQERSNMLIQMSEEKSQARAEIERLKDDIDSCEKEANSLKYEVHIARKEAEIRNEERNMSVRSADVANKQHLEGAKKIAKLEAECQRLRSLVRKKLPGPGALAQMKLEVEKNYGESRLRRSPAKASNTHSLQQNEFLLDGSQKYIKENELLTERLLEMEEETKMLKEALGKRNSELQACRSLMRLDTQVGHGEEIYSQRGGKQLSFASVSEDGNDDTMSCSGQWTTSSLTSEPFHLKKKKNIDSSQKSESGNHLDLMDDFLEMEKLACLSNGTPLSKALDNTGGDARSEVMSNEGLGEAIIGRDSQENANVTNRQLQLDSLTFVELQSKVSNVLESMSSGKEMEMIADDIRHVMHYLHGTVSEGPKLQYTKDLSLSGDGQELQTAITQIYEFIMILGKEANTVPGATPEGKGLNEKLDTFSVKYTEAINRDIDLIDFVLDTSHVLKRAGELHFNVLGFKGSEVEPDSSDCIDKIALPENKPVVDSLHGCARFSDSASDTDVPNDGSGSLVPTSESTANSWKCSLEEFEQLKSDKDEVADKLGRCIENFENTKSQLLETEQVLAEVKSELTSAQKSNSLAETQLKCMAESYKSLETRKDELESEVSILQGKLKSLDIELKEERRCHQVALDRCNDLQEQLQSSEAADIDDKPNQEMELAAATEKLAECQETIFLLGKQLNSLRPQADILNSQNQTIKSLQDTDTSASHLQRGGSESRLVDSFIPSEFEANELLISPNSSKNARHRHTKSGSSFPLSEKHGNVLSRFFSPKGKSGQ